jgi:hypothetical protein
MNEEEIKVLQNSVYKQKELENSCILKPLRNLNNKDCIIKISVDNTYSNDKLVVKLNYSNLLDR